MALEVLQRTQPNYAEILGTGLSQGLKTLAGNKLKQIETRNGLRALLPQDQYSDEQVEQISYLAAKDPNILQQITKGTFGAGKVSDQEKKQKFIDSANKTWNTNFDKSLDIAQKMENIAAQMEELLATGKVKSGVIGKYTPDFLLDDSSRTFEALSNELASLIASNSGVATNFKIKLAQSMKPNLSQPRATQLKLLENVRKQAGKIISKGEIRDNLIAQNNGMQPQNIGSLVEKMYKEQKISKASQQFNKRIKDIPQEELEDTLNQLVQGNAAIGTSVDFDNGMRLYWDGKELVEKNPVGV